MSSTKPKKKTKTPSLVSVSVALIDSLLPAMSIKTPRISNPLKQATSKKHKNCNFDHLGR